MKRQQSKYNLSTTQVAPTAMVLPSIVSEGTFLDITRVDNLGPQLALDGSPLYRFSQDGLQRGSVLGQAGGPNANFFVKTTVQ